MAGDKGNKVALNTNRVLKKGASDLFERLDRYETMNNGYLFYPVTSLKHQII